MQFDFENDRAYFERDTKIGGIERDVLDYPRDWAWVSIAGLVDQIRTRKLALENQKHDTGVPDFKSMGVLNMIASDLSSRRPDLTI